MLSSSPFLAATGPSPLVSCRRSPTLHSSPRFPTGSDRSERQRNECREETKGTGDRRERGTRLITLSLRSSSRYPPSAEAFGRRQEEGRDSDEARTRSTVGLSVGTSFRSSSGWRLPRLCRRTVRISLPTASRPIATRREEHRREGMRSGEGERYRRRASDGRRIWHRLTLDLWLAKDNRFLNPKSSYKRILMAPSCRFISSPIPPSLATLARFHYL